MVKKVVRLTTQEKQRIAQLLREAFPTYREPGVAEEETDNLCSDEKLLYLKMLDKRIVGLIGAIPQYGVTGWELHPLLVEDKHKDKGFGKALIEALENGVKEAGGIVLYLGTDDEHNQTSLSHVDIFNDVYTHIKNIKNIRNHPYTFYEKMGYKIVGLIPDANGFGKPDIMMAKRLVEYQAK